MKFLKLEVEADSVIIGERLKGGIYRPCLETIPSTTVKGAFRHALGIDVIGVGTFEAGTYELRDFTYSVKDKFLETAKMPLISSCLYSAGNQKIKATIYLAKNSSIDVTKLNNLTFAIGALKSKGFGKAKVVRIGEIESETRQGLLKVRVLEEDAPALGITPLSPVYGYLFRPSNPLSGVYQRALFEGSLVKAPEIFLMEVTFYDEQNG